MADLCTNATAKQMLLQLVHLGEGTADTRQRVIGRLMMPVRVAGFFGGSRVIDGLRSKA